MVVFGQYYGLKTDIIIVMQNAIINSLPFILSVVAVKIFQQLKLIRKEDKQAVASLTFNIVVPALIILLMGTIDLHFSDLKYTLMALLTWLVAGIAGLATSKLLKLSKKQEGTIVVGFLSFSIGVLVYPLVQLNYSNDVFLRVVLYDVIGHFFILMTLTYLVATMYGEKSNGSLVSNIKTVQLSPIVISMVVGVILSITKLSHPIFMETLNYMSSAFGMLAATLLALTLTMPRAKGLVTVGVSTVIKLLVGLASGIAVTKMFGVTGDTSAALLLATASPVSLTTIVFSEMVGLDTELISQFTAVSLIVGLIVLPIAMGIL